MPTATVAANGKREKTKPEQRLCNGFFLANLLILLLVSA